MTIRDNFCQFCIKPYMYVVTPHLKCLDETIQVRVTLYGFNKKKYHQIPPPPPYLELCQDIVGRMDSSETIFYFFFTENICCDPSLEPSQRDGSNEGSQHTFLCRWNVSLNYPCLLILSEIQCIGYT